MRAVGRSVLACASSGGHFKELVSLVPRISRVDSVTWVAFDTGLERELLEAAGRGDDELVTVPYAAPRDLRNLARDARIVRRLLRERSYDLAVSTGAGLAVASLPLARASGVRSCFIESSTRTQTPSLSGRILERVPGIEHYAQQPGFGPRWRQVSSVHDGFAPGPNKELVRIERAVVTLGTMRTYGFRSVINAVRAALPSSCEVLWQTGATDVTDLDIDAREHVPGEELKHAMSEADVVIAHAGAGTALTAFEVGRTPVLVPRRHVRGEHVDDHQVLIARLLAERGLAVHLEVEQVSGERLLEAGRRTVVTLDEPPPLPI